MLITFMCFSSCTRLYSTGYSYTLTSVLFTTVWATHSRQAQNVIFSETLSFERMNENTAKVSRCDNFSYQERHSVSFVIFRYYSSNTDSTQHFVWVPQVITEIAMFRVETDNYNAIELKLFLCTRYNHRLTPEIFSLCKLNT